MSREERRLSFGAHAEEYERARPEWPLEAARWLVPEGAALVVELGAGTGKLTLALAAAAPRVVAVEPDPRMRELLPGAVAGTAEEIPLRDGEADAVVAGSSLHWFELERALPEFRRVLREGGRLAFGWNHRDDVRLEQMSAAIRALRPLGESWRARDWASEVTAGGLFGGVERALRALARAAAGGSGGASPLLLGRRTASRTGPRAAGIARRGDPRHRPVPRVGRRLRLVAPLRRGRLSRRHESGTSLVPVALKVA